VQETGDTVSGTDDGYNILMIAPTSFFADYGCHVRILEEALILRKMGNRVTICTYHNGRNLDGLDIQRSLWIPWRKDYEVGSSRHKIGLDVLLSVKSLQVALQYKPDIVHAHLHEGALIGYPLSLLCNAPLVFDLQGSLTGEMLDHHFLKPDGLFYRPMRWLEGIINHLPDAIITSSHNAANLLRSEFGCPAELIHPVPDCVNADFFSPRKDEETTQVLRARWGVPSDRQVVVYLGLLAEYQGIRHLLQAAALLCPRYNVHFLIMGFPMVEQYRQVARELGIDDRVTFTGQVPYERAPFALSLGDVAVAPKLSATEGCGKILNYMAMGLPTVTFDMPVNREYLGDLGVYAEKGNVPALADAIASLLDDEERRTSLGAALRARVVERYSWEQAGRKIMAIYRSVLNR